MERFILESYSSFFFLVLIDLPSLMSLHLGYSACFGIWKDKPLTDCCLHQLPQLSQILCYDFAFFNIRQLSITG